MGWWIKDHIAVNDDETKQLCSIEADTQASLPAADQTGTAGFTIVRGSSALVLDTGDNYMMNSVGTWVQQPSGVRLDLSGYATTQYVDTGLAAKVDTTTYTNGQSAQDAEISVISAQGAKNLCPYNSFSASASGTIINDQPINLPAGTYILSFKHTATTGSSAFRFLNSGVSVETLTVNNREGGEETRTFTLASDANEIRAYTSVANEYTEFMIRHAEITDSTFVPYAPTNRELYEMILALQ